MSLTSKKLAEVILAIVAIALIVGVVLCFATPLGDAFSGILQKQHEVANGDIWQPGTYNPGGNGGNGGSGEQPGDEDEDLVPGLYQTGTNYGTMITPWDELLAAGTVHVENGVVYTNVDMGTGSNSSSAALAGDLVIPDDGSITTIGNFDGDSGTGNMAFAMCSSLTGVTIPDSVTSIGDYAFVGCSGLTSIEIPASVTTIGDYAFQACAGLTSVEIPASVTTIGNGAFSWSGLTSIEIPDSITSIGEIAFAECTGLTSVTFAENSRLTSIGVRAFRGCTGLTSIEIPASVTSIGVEAFSSCEVLTSIEIPAGVTFIDTYAFSGCTNLTKVYYEGTLEQWCNITFVYTNPCENGADLYIQGKKIENLVIPSTVTEIKAFAFMGCTSLTSVEIPDSVTSIGQSAFSDCSELTSIEIPDGVTSIGNYAFYGCKGLTSITFEGTVAQWNAITKGADWNYQVPATEVVCSDGSVSIGK